MTVQILFLSVTILTEQFAEAVWWVIHYLNCEINAP